MRTGPSDDSSTEVISQSSSRTTTTLPGAKVSVLLIVGWSLSRMPQTWAAAQQLVSLRGADIQLRQEIQEVSSCSFFKVEST